MLTKPRELNKGDVIEIPGSTWYEQVNGSDVRQCLTGKVRSVVPHHAVPSLFSIIHFDDGTCVMARTDTLVTVLKTSDTDPGAHPGK